MKSRVMLFAALATTAAGCKKEQPAPAAPATAAAPAPAPAPVRKDALAEVPLTDSTLSVLTPGNDACEWLRVDPSAHKSATVASFDGGCKGARVSFSPDLRKALVWFDPTLVFTSGYSSTDASASGFNPEKPTPGARNRLFEVTIASGEVRPVPFPSVAGTVTEIGYDAQGIIATALRSLSEEERAKDSITVDGQELAFDKELEGLPALAYAWRPSADGAWKHVEVKATSEGADLSLGVGVLKASPKGPESTELLTSHPRVLDEEPTPEQISRLLPLVPPNLVEKVKTEGMPEGDGWVRGSTPAGAFYAWQVTGEFAHTTGHLVLERGGQLYPVKDLRFTDGDLVGIDVRGAFLLVASANVGSHPRLYDLRTGERVFSSEDARAVTFWPREKQEKKDAQAATDTP
jgi:hypothetical protein